MGYAPRVLIQFEDEALRRQLALSNLYITQEGYNDPNWVCPVYADRMNPTRN
jgi:hypothetical protein